MFANSAIVVFGALWVLINCLAQVTDPSTCFGGEHLSNTIMTKERKKA